MPKKLDIILSRALVEKGIIPQKDVDALLREADASSSSLQQVLVKRNILPERDILNILSEKTGIVCSNIKDAAIEKAVLDKVPVKVAAYYKFVPLKIKDRVLTIAVSTPMDIKTQDEIRTQLGLDMDFVLSCQNDIMDLLKKHYGFAADTLERMVSQTVSTGQTAQAKIEDIEKLAEDASVIKLVNQIILDAFRKRATDIHIEPYRDGLALRYRVDGLLYDSNVPVDMKNFLNAIISRIKIMANLNIVERRLPQDGRAIVKVQEQVLDLRISTMPTPYGESVVIRILPSQMLFSLEKLGLAKRDLQIFEGIIKKPHGIVFVTGPTGSGKTTTLYACLSRINTKERKIITIEDPIEYEMSGITQIQVMPEIGLDFARGLRSILRHDPDVIMVGEVRDLETAEIAIRVALTGHLVFSTLHTNDAASGITRLVDIGLEPYLVSSSVEAFIAQRLIRVICPDCKTEDKQAPIELKQMIARDIGLKAQDITIYRGKGCNSCNFTGFFGRTAIYEILTVDDEIKDLIVKKSPPNQIKKVCVSKKGMRTLRQDGWQKVILGMTTPEEVMKVTSAEDYPEETSQEGPSPIYYSSMLNLSSGPSADLDRRIYKRLGEKVNIRYKIVRSQQDTKRAFYPEQLSVTSDISAGGLLFADNELLPQGTMIELKIELPDNESPIECLARVVRTQETGRQPAYAIAVCFLDITGADRTRLNKHIDSQT